MTNTAQIVERRIGKALCLYEELRGSQEVMALQVVGLAGTTLLYYDR